MKVNLLKKNTIFDYCGENPSSKKPFLRWLEIIKYADWDKPEDIIKTFNSADILGQGVKRVVFNIGGNNYRMLCSYMFGDKTSFLFVKWIGTHAEYDELCKEGKQYTINKY